MRSTTINLLHRTSWALAAPLFIAFLSLNVGVFLSADSPLYIRYARAIFSSGFIENYPQLATRTPLYPLLLGAELTALNGHSLPFLVTHFLLALLSLICLSYHFRKHVAPLVTFYLLLITYVAMRYPFKFVMTEWLSFHIILWSVACAAWHLRNPNFFRLLSVSFLCTLATLTRPNLIVTFLVPGYIALMSWRRYALLVSGAALLSGLVPVLAWMCFNYYTIKHFVIAPLGGISIFGVATVIGAPQPEKSDSPQFKAFLQEVNSNKSPPAGAEREKLLSSKSADEFLNSYFEPYHDNIWRVGVTAAQHQGWDMTEFNDQAMIYSARSIRTNFLNYLLYISGGLKRLLSLVPLLIIYILALRRKNTPPPQELRVALHAFILLHLINTMLCSSIQILDVRYYDLTYWPTFFLVCINVFSESRFQKTPAAPYHPRQSHPHAHQL